mgnify:CR=1 FL=1
MGKNKTLMCPPMYFALEYEINPWMDKKNEVNREKSIKQWDELVGVYLKNKSNVKILNPVIGLPDMVFTANGAFVIKNKALISNFKFKERKNESKIFEKWFKVNGYEVIRIPNEIIFEGQGDAFNFNDKIFAGFGFRSILKSHLYLKNLFHKEVVSLRLINPKFYHLDTCFCILKNGEAVYYPGAFNKDSVLKIKKNFKITIEINEYDALKFFCNSVSIDNLLVTSTKGYTSKSLSAIKKLGYIIKSVDLSEFKKSGGGARCLTLSI